MQAVVTMAMCERIGGLGSRSKCLLLTGNRCEAVFSPPKWRS